MSAAFYLPGIAESKHKVLELIKALKDMAMWRLVLSAGFAKTFTSMNKAIRGLIKDTGSLDAALGRLAGIQKLQKTFSGLVGGIDAAKTRIAQLVALSNSSGRAFKFESWGKAAQTLQVFTRGAYASNDALKSIGDTAASTGNSLEDVADGVASFYNALRNGQPVGEAADKLRQMGVITDENASLLKDLASAGEDTGQVFDQLTSIMDKHRGGMDALADSVEGVAEAHEKAAEKIKEAVGKPWTEKDIQVTKNMTDAMNAMAPAAGRVSSFYSILSNGFSTLGSWLAKTISQSPLMSGAMESMAKAVGLAIMAVSIFGTVAIPAAVMSVTKLIGYLSGEGIAALAGFGKYSIWAARGIGFLSIAMKGLAVAVGVFAGGSAILAIGGAIINMAEDGKKAAKEAEEFAKSIKAATDAIGGQISAVTTLTEKHEALAAAIKGVKDAQEEVANQRANINGGTFGEAVADLVNGGKYKKARRDKLNAANKSESDRRSLEERAASIPEGSLAPGVAEKRSISETSSRALQLEEETYQAQLEKASPEDKIGIMRDRAAVISKRGESGVSGIDAASSVERRRSSYASKIGAAEMDIQDQQKAVEEISKRKGATKSQKKSARDNLKDDTDYLNYLRAYQLHEGLNSPEGSSVNIRTRIAMMSAGNNANALAAINGDKDPEVKRLRMMSGGLSGTGKEKAKLEADADRQEKIEAAATPNTIEAKAKRAQIELAERELALAKTRQDTELKISQIKEIGFDRTEKENALKMKQLDREIDFAKHTGQTGRQTELEAQKNDLEKSMQEQGRSEALSLSQSDMEVSHQAAELKGDSKEMQKLDNLSVFQQKFEELRQIMPGNDAKDRAMSFASNSIALKARDQAMEYNNSAKVSSLAALGLGGNVGPGAGNPMQTVAEQQKALQEQANDYLDGIRIAVEGFVDAIKVK